MASSEANRKSMLDCALDYVRLEYPCFPVCSPRMGQHTHRTAGRDEPCKSPGKRPLVSWEAYQSRLPTTDEVTAWWTRWPLANIGMATGVRSGVVVLDCDSGEARQLALSNGGLDKTPAVWTGKPGGVHFWLEHPVEAVRNFARRLPGLDFRGDGGYVLLPPSAHASGATYRWNPHTIGMRPAPIPDWLWELLRGGGGTDDEPRGEHGSLDIEEMLRGFDEGHRDDGLFRFACRLRHDDTPLAYAEALIATAAQHCRPPFDTDEAIEKVRYVYRKYEAGSVGPTVTEDEYFAAPGSATGTPLDEAPDDEPATWKVYDIADFLAIEFPPVVWRIEGYLRERAILFSFGAPGSIKTFVATDAALAIASGGLFLGKFPCQSGRVLIVQEDTLASDFQQAYLRPMIEARSLTGSDLRGQLFIAPQAEFSLDQHDRLRDLAAWLDEHKPDLLILDAFYLMYSGRKEDLLHVMKIVKKIRNKYGCSIWIIDHNRKGQGDASGENPIDRLINGREKSAAVDVVMESRPVKGEQGSTFLDVLKLRGAKMPEAIRVTYADGRLTVDGDEEVSPKGAAETVYEWLCREGASRTIRQIIAGTGLAERTVRGAVSELHRDGLARPFNGPGMAKTWYGIRRSEADPEPEPGPTFVWDE